MHLKVEIEDWTAPSLRVIGELASFDQLVEPMVGVPVTLRAGGVPRLEQRSDSRGFFAFEHPAGEPLDLLLVPKGDRPVSARLLPPCLL